MADTSVVITETKTLPFSFTLPVVGAAGAFFGLFVGTAQGSGPLGIAIGFVLCAALAYGALGVAGVARERLVRWGCIGGFGAAGAAIGAEGTLRTVVLPEIDAFAAPILYSVPAQLLAYHAAATLGKDVDQPRNLAKSVTVE